jgi:hypothetical protein
MLHNEQTHLGQIVNLCCARSAVNESVWSHTETSLFDNDKSFKNRCLLAVEEFMKNTRKTCNLASHKDPTRLLGALTHWPHRKDKEPSQNISSNICRNGRPIF